MKRALALAAAATLFAGCARPPSTRDAVSPPAATARGRDAASGRPLPAATPTTVPIEVRSHRVGSRYIYLTKQKGARKVYVLRADSESGRYFGGDSGRSDFVNPHITFYAADGRRIVADAPAGEIVAKDKLVRMTGGVRARTTDGKTLTSDTLRYDDGDEIVHGDGNVSVTTPAGERLQGDTLVWDTRSGRLDVTGTR